MQLDPTLLQNKLLSNPYFLPYTCYGIDAPLGIALGIVDV